MKIERIPNYHTDASITKHIPICIFMSADFRSDDPILKKFDKQFELRRKFKYRYRYYRDLYFFDSRNGDCLEIKQNGIHVFGLVYHGEAGLNPSDDEIRGAFIQLKKYIFREKIKEVQLSLDGIAKFCDYMDILDFIFDLFNLTDTTFYITGGKHD